MADHDPAALEDLAISLAEGAAAVVRAAAGDPLDVTAKSTATDLVTQVDRASEQWLVDQLGARRPSDTVLAEEGGERGQNPPERGSGRVRWLLDPIDGTVNFVLGLPQYAVSVAAEVDGQVFAGAVCNPATGECFHAHRGGGAFLGQQRLAGPRDVGLELAVVATGFGYDARLRAEQARVVAELLPRVADVRRLGSAALDLCWLAAGRLDGYYEAGLQPWDYAAGALIAREAGCLVTGRAHGQGSAREPASGELVAAAGPAMGQRFFELLDTLGAGRVSS